MRKIIVLDYKVDNLTGNTSVKAAFWLQAPQNRIIPLGSNFRSAVPVATSYPTWSPGIVYAKGAVVLPTSTNGLAFTAVAVSGTGTSSNTQPTWPTTPGATVVDNAGANQITWECNATDLNSGISTDELTMLQNGLLVEQIWTTNEQTTEAALQAEIQAAYNQTQTTLTATAFSARRLLYSWDGTNWGAPL